MHQFPHQEYQGYIRVSSQNQTPTEWMDGDTVARLLFVLL